MKDRGRPHHLPVHWSILLCWPSGGFIYPLMSTTPSTDTSSPATGDAPSNVITLPGLSKRDRTKSDDRWSDAVMERGHTIIPTILFWGQAKLGLTPDELNVLLQIISHWFYGGNDPHPSK